MAHSVSAKKRIRQNEAHRSRNRWRLRAMRAAIKDFESAVSGGDASAARDSFQKACSVIDRTAQKGVIHKRQADRRKSRLNQRLKSSISG
ncbi:MAG: 30S ribosomal protein S20 [Planctomycetota bacterium]